MDDFTLSSVRCVSSEEALRAPAPDGSFRMGGIQWGQGKELAANATLLPGDTPQCKGDIDTVRTIAKTIAMRVPHGYVDAEDITTASYDPMGAILRHRDHERVGMCGDACRTACPGARAMWSAISCRTDTKSGRVRARHWGGVGLQSIVS
jgi:hypothetical protein